MINSSFVIFSLKVDDDWVLVQFRFEGGVLKKAVPLTPSQYYALISLPVVSEHEIVDDYTDILPDNEVKAFKKKLKSCLEAGSLSF